jgi:alpha-glucosidase
MQPEVTDRAVYFPEGEWIDYFSGKVYEGGTTHLVHAELDTLPLFIKRGTLIAQSPIRTKTEQKELELHVYAHTKGSYNTSVYDDDGETTNYYSGEAMKLNLSIQCKDHQIAISYRNDNEMEWPLPYKKCSFILHGLVDDQQVWVNGERQSGVWTEQGLKVEVTI